MCLSHALKYKRDTLVQEVTRACRYAHFNVNDCVQEMTRLPHAEMYMRVHYRGLSTFSLELLADAAQFVSFVRRSQNPGASLCDNQ